MRHAHAKRPAFLRAGICSHLNANWVRCLRRHVWQFAKQVLAGHARLLAAKQLGLPEVPTIRIAHMSAAQKRAYIIADNKLAENAKWDRKMLALEHEAIQLLDPDFDLTISGFGLEEIQIATPATEPNVGCGLGAAQGVLVTHLAGSSSALSLPFCDKVSPKYSAPWN